MTTTSTKTYWLAGDDVYETTPYTTIWDAIEYTVFEHPLATTPEELAMAIGHLTLTEYVDALPTDKDIKRLTSRLLEVLLEEWDDEDGFGDPENETELPEWISNLISSRLESAITPLVEMIERDPQRTVSSGRPVVYEGDELVGLLRAHVPQDEWDKRIKGRDR